MSTATTVTRAPAAASVVEANLHDLAELSPAGSTTGLLRRRPTDDEILGIEADETLPGKLRTESKAQSRSRDRRTGEALDAFEDRAGKSDETAEPELAAVTDGAREPESLRAAFDANPELRQAWQDAQAYREAFATPEEARAATAQLADLSRMDALFFSQRPEDHAELARIVAQLDPAAFASLAEAMGRFATTAKAAPERAAAEQRDANAASRRDAAGDDRAMTAHPQTPTVAQEQFFRATNADAVQSVIEAIETQVERLLPEKISKTARNRVVGEIYRELDTTLQGNVQFTRQLREAMRTGTLDVAHQRAMVSLISNRARQALPAVAKRVLSEWTSTVVAASQDRRERQRAAERRVDIGGSGGGSEGRKTLGPRDIDYGRMSDGDILNL